MSDSLRDDILKAAQNANKYTMYWIKDTSIKFRCSSCGRSVIQKERYCPSCGKKDIGNIVWR